MYKMLNIIKKVCRIRAKKKCDDQKNPKCTIRSG